MLKEPAGGQASGRTRPKPLPLSFKQKLRRKERRADAERRAQNSPILGDSPLSSPEDEFGTCINSDQIRQIQQEGGSCIETCLAPRGRSDGVHRSASPRSPGKAVPVAGGSHVLLRDMNKSRLTRYLEKKRQPVNWPAAPAGARLQHSKELRTDESTNLHSVGVDPRGRSRQAGGKVGGAVSGVTTGQARSRARAGGDEWEEFETGNRMGSACKLNHQVTANSSGVFTGRAQMSQQLAEARQKGAKRETIIYGVIALLCVCSGRLDGSAIAMRVVCCIIVAIVMKAFNISKLEIPGLS